ncbi:hypothetical protein EHP00_910 [Ecytonucleospora hepatopenaei]|uniref:Protein-serine O-palmitoleoyltransferase porcupine n=1 Tax=Ecytonucleospora hepatopenaei TaxID=646526 RepID=A0A1W0E4U4_9MICR|nr:hypothetical protein EHP00_910 [Ecytonucleospora hepatopenaei]
MINNYEVGFLLAMYTAIIASYLLHITNYKKHILVNFIFTTLVSFFAFGVRHLLILFLTTFLNLILLVFLRNRKFPQIFVIFNIFLSYVYQIFYRKLYNIGQMYDMSGMFFLYMLKMCYIADSWNGNLVDAFNYLFNVSNFLFGPIINFSEFIFNFKNKELLNDKVENKTETSGKNEKEIKKEKGENMVKYFNGPEDKKLYSICVLKQHLCFFSFFILTKSFDLDRKMFEAKNALVTLSFVVLKCLQYRSILYFCWTSSAFCFILLNFRVNNFNVLRVELPNNIQEISKNWNIATHRFFKIYFFNPLINKTKNKKISALLTYLFSALMHSFDIKTLCFFVGMGFSSPFFDKALTILPFIKESIVSRQMITILFTSFLGMAKLSNTFGETLKIWRKLCFYGIWMYLAIVFLFLFKTLKETATFKILFQAKPTVKNEQ